VPARTGGRLVAVLGFMSVVTAAMRVDQIERLLVDERLEADQRDPDQRHGERVQHGDHLG
jgi:hypothetical protein